MRGLPDPGQHLVTADERLRTFGRIPRLDHPQPHQTNRRGRAAHRQKQVASRAALPAQESLASAAAHIAQAIPVGRGVLDDAVLADKLHQSQVDHRAGWCLDFEGLKPGDLLV